MSLLAGAVVFIDDELKDRKSQAAALLEEIRATGRPVAWALSIPEDRDSWFEHWQSLAFVVLDWDLSPSSGGSTGGSTLSDYERRRLYEFVDELMRRVYCPVFIISAEDVNDIQRQILEDDRFVLPNGSLDARIAVFSKDVLMDNIVAHLTEWMSRSPSLSALRAWELEYDSAKNRLLIELNEVEPDWPVYVWRAADYDQVDPAYELASVISTNLLNRFNPIIFDVGAITGYAGPTTGVARRRVSQGRTAVPGDRLSEVMVLPGDIFLFPEAEDGDVWINVSPACHTVGRLLETLADGTEVREPVRLHLLRGKPVSWPSTAGALKTMDSTDRANSIVIHTLLEGNPYRFVFGDAQIVDWANVREHRVARLMQPFITRVQQLHAAYIQSEGLPKVTLELYAADIGAAGPPVPR